MIDVDAGVDFPFVTRRFITTTTMTNQPVGATSLGFSDAVGRSFPQPIKTALVAV